MRIGLIAGFTPIVSAVIADTDAGRMSLDHAPDAGTGFSARGMA
jgi:hypothetical protein